MSFRRDSDVSVENECRRNIVDDDAYAEAVVII
jgi:hypothetical protein